MLTEQEKFARLDGIGASEVAAILGVEEDTWGPNGKIRGRKADDILALKTGQKPEFEGNQYTYWGNKLEPLIADWYVETYGGEQHRSGAIKSCTVPWAFCTPDRIIVRDNAKHGLECKNKAYSQKTKWKTGPPESILCQVKWSMMVTEWDRWDVAVLFNGNDPRAYVIDRDRTWEEMALEKVGAFWERVQQSNHDLWG